MAERKRRFIFETGMEVRMFPPKTLDGLAEGDVLDFRCSAEELIETVAYETAIYPISFFALKRDGDRIEKISYKFLDIGVDSNCAFFSRVTTDLFRKCDNGYDNCNKKLIGAGK